jgi:hypothetical protein
VPGRGLYGNAHSYTDTNGDAAGHTLADSQCHGNSKLYPHTEAFAYLHQHPNRFGNTEPDAIAPTFANANGEPVGNSESNLDVDASTQSHADANGVTDSDCSRLPWCGVYGDANSHNGAHCDAHAKCNPDAVFRGGVCDEVLGSQW